MSKRLTDVEQEMFSVVPVCRACGREYGEWPMKPSQVPAIPVCGPCAHRIRERGGNEAMERFRRGQS